MTWGVARARHGGDAPSYDMVRVTGGYDMDRFTTREAARVLNVSRRTFQRWVSAHQVESEVEYGATGATHLYSRAALEHLLQQVRGEDAAGQVARLDAGVRGDDMAEPAPPAQPASSPPATGGDMPHAIALPPSAHVEEFLTLMADLRDAVCRSAAQEDRVANMLSRVDESLRRLPGPPAPPSRPPKFRPRVVAEVVLLGAVGLLAALLGALVLWQAHEHGILDQIAVSVGR